MKKTNAKKSETPESHLLEGASILMKGFETPANFLTFIAQLMYWIELYYDAKKDEVRNTYPIKMMIAQIARPWVDNGSNVCEEISKGILFLYDFLGHEAYLDFLSDLMQGFTIDLQAGSYQVEEMKQYFSGFITMYQVGDYIGYYDRTKIIKKEREKLSNAA